MQERGSTRSEFSFLNKSQKLGLVCKAFRFLNIDSFRKLKHLSAGQVGRYPVARGRHLGGAAHAWPYDGGGIVICLFGCLPDGCFLGSGVAW